MSNAGEVAQVHGLPRLEWRSWRTPFVFFTGKGGVGKTTVAGTTAVALADAGRRVLLVSTDPASNLDDLLGTTVGPQPHIVPGVPGLEAMNLDPDAAATAYRERVIGPYRGVVPPEELRGIEEQLAGECTVEVAAFDEFTQLIVRPELVGRYDHVLFDTAPTGHTLRLLNLPSAWSDYLEASPGGASCLGPRSGLQAQRTQYREAVRQLATPERTTLVLVSRPDPAALREAARAGSELAAQGIRNQRLVVNGLLADPLPGDEVAETISAHQTSALDARPASLRTVPTSGVPLVAIDLTGVAALRALSAGQKTSEPHVRTATSSREEITLPALSGLVDELAAGPPCAILVMGKGGVGKTTIAAAIAIGLANRGHPVHLSTTDPAGTPDDVLTGELPPQLTVSRIDPATELARYTAERLRATDDVAPQRRALIEEDLRSPCTEELAVFRAFSRLLTEARRRFVVVDTAPSGHTLRLLDLTGSYHRQVMTGGGIPGRVTTPMMRLQDPTRTRVLVVTRPESTPVSEAKALQDDLRRAGIEPHGWIVNAALTTSGTEDPLLLTRAALEHRHLHRIRDNLATRAWLVPWQIDELLGEGHLTALTRT